MSNSQNSAHTSVATESHTSYWDQLVSIRLLSNVRSPIRWLACFFQSNHQLIPTVAEGRLDIYLNKENPQNESNHELVAWPVHVCGIYSILNHWLRTWPFDVWSWLLEDMIRLMSCPGVRPCVAYPPLYSQDGVRAWRSYLVLQSLRAGPC